MKVVAWLWAMARTWWVGDVMSLMSFGEAMTLIEKRYFAELDITTKDGARYWWLVTHTEQRALIKKLGNRTKKVITVHCANGERHKFRRADVVRFLLTVIISVDGTCFRGKTIQVKL